MSAMCRMTWYSSRMPLPPSRSRASAITCRALRVLFIFAIAAMVSVRVPAFCSLPSRRQYSCMEQTSASIFTSRSCTIWKLTSGLPNCSRCWV